MQNPTREYPTKYLSHITSLLIIPLCLFSGLGCADQQTWSDDDQSISKSLTIYTGDSCSAGCIWSSFAVSQGLQASEVNCNGQMCACVVRGDASTSCVAEPEEEVTLARSSAQSRAGTSCNSGCIWSTYAVSIGAQESSSTCDGAPCACVKDGDVWQLCEASDPSLDAPENRSTLPESISPDTSPAGRMPDVPYFYQYDNSLHPSASCQNTSVAMVLSYLGWRGTPDQITSRYGKDWAQSPAGLAALFNRYVESAGLSMRLQPTTSGTLSGLRAELDRGHPVIIHGYFTRYGHVMVVLDYDANGYYLNDPAGRWSEYFMGGYSGGGSGRGVYYSKAAFEAAASTSDGYSHLPIWYHALR